MAGSTGLIAVDWGSTSFRAYRIGADGDILDMRKADAGITRVENGAFGAALDAAIGDWVDARPPVVLSGMITSRNGWVETPYAFTPAGETDIAAKVARRQHNGLELYFLPGVAMRAPGDVMRGEETQIIGAGVHDGTIVLPGTHSKWVSLRDGRITRLSTFLTGEMFALLRQHSLVGKLAEGDADDKEAFALGVERGLTGEDEGPGLLGLVFSARADVLLGTLAPRAASAYLSGLVIGAEFGGGRRLSESRQVRLIGSETLMDRYRRAAELAGITAETGPTDAAPRGIVRIARALSLLD